MIPRPLLVLLATLSLVSCRAPEPASPAAAGTLVHLTDLLQGAEVTSAAPPESARRERRWSAAELHESWRTLSSDDLPYLAGVELEPTDDALRLYLNRGQPPGLRAGGLVIDLGDLRYQDVQRLEVRARSSDRFAGLTVATNLDEEGALPHPRAFFTSPDEVPPVFNDGSLQTYSIPIRPRPGTEPSAVLRDLALLFGAPGPASIDVLEVTLVPRGADFLDDAGSRPLTRAGTTRDTLFAHAPAELAFDVDVPVAGRLDFGLAVSPGETITYRVSAELDGHPRRLFEETVDDPETWHQRSVDLSDVARTKACLVLEAESTSEGAVALWGAPILSGAGAREKPDVVFYVIDAGDANLMSVYGYGRPTTPFLERLAEEGVLFTRAYANATWTQPSTVSFMTSLHHSVLGGLRRGIHSTPVPAAAVTMAENFRRGGYQTASLTANPNAGRLLGLERGVDWLRDFETEHHSTSSIELHEQYFRFREAYPGSPTWVHFQTTDVHEPNEPHEPFAGRFVSAGERARLDEWTGRFWQAGGSIFGTTSVDDFYARAIERAGIDRKAYFEARRGLYDETMLHQDHALERFVAELKASGAWQNTLFVVASDHGHPAGTFARFGRGLFEPQPEPWQGALFDAYASRVPLLVIWPGHLEAGRRVETPVSMIDVLPTLLDLLDLPLPEVRQGRSLAPLLRGGELDPRPVVLDEFRVDEATGEMVGNLEIVDGRWGASLEIAPVEDGSDPGRGRHAVPAGGRWGAVHPFYPDVPRLLLYDLEADPFARRAVNDRHPELVRRYSRELLEIWEGHQVLAGQFSNAEAAPLTPDQLRQLRALGYIP